MLRNYGVSLYILNKKFLKAKRLADREGFEPSVTLTATHP